MKEGSKEFKEFWLNRYKEQIIYLRELDNRLERGTLSLERYKEVVESAQVVAYRCIQNASITNFYFNYC